MESLEREKKPGEGTKDRTYRVRSYGRING